LAVWRLVELYLVSNPLSDNVKVNSGKEEKEGGKGGKKGKKGVLRQIMLYAFTWTVCRELFNTFIHYRKK
jgi:hypothetical protein